MSNSNVSPSSSSSQVVAASRWPDANNQILNSGDLPPSYHELTTIAHSPHSKNSSGIDGKASYEEWINSQKKSSN